MRSGRAMLGRVLEKWYPNGVNSQYEWNADNTLAKLRNRVNYDDYAVVSRHEYAYTGLGQRQSLIEKVGQLAQPAQDEAYAYDAWDNRVRQTKNGVTHHAVLDAAQQLLELRQGSPTGPLAAAFVFDANGNLRKKCEGGTVT
ncbi:MAG: hypothetical protein MUC79_07070, partial [Thiobacillaceae bacterium]|nr:hypothetical protein [Thiobacillaceae bacterium]